MRTALLDINGGLTHHADQHDVVVAANVLHNAVDVRATLAAALPIGDDALRALGQQLLVAVR
ncbi:hypothetical protein WEH80_18660 [Actinomycetes bacterium KLBMP 9759]